MPNPLVDLRQVRNRSVLTADVSGFLISIAMYLLLPIIVEFVQIPRSAGDGFDASLVVSGLILTPLSVGSFVASRFLVVYERRFGSRTHDPARLGGVRGGRDVFALEHSALWQAFVTLPYAGLGRRLHHRGNARVHHPGRAPERDRERYRLLPGSAQYRLDGGKRAERRRADGPHPAGSGPAGRGTASRAALIIAAALCLATAAVSFVLPGRAPSPPTALDRRSRRRTSKC